MPLDANDVLRSAGPDALRSALSNGVAFIPRHDRTPADREKPPRFEIEPLDAFTDFRQTMWRVKGLLPSKGFAVIYGAPSAGKSFVALDLALHVAAGRAWCGRRVSKGGVLYLAAEGENGFVNRAIVARNHLQLPECTHFAVCFEAPNLGIENGDLAYLCDAIWRHEQQAGWKVRLLVLDTLARVTTGIDENSARDMGAFIQNADRLARSIDGMVIAVHHAGKSAERGMRGSSSLLGAADSVWEVAKTDRNHSVQVQKQKDGDDNIEWSFQIVRQPIGADTDGDEQTVGRIEFSSVPAVRDCSGKGKPKRLNASDNLVLQAIKEAHSDCAKQLPGTNDFPRGVKGIQRKDIDKHLISKGFFEGLKPESFAATVRRSLVNLIAAKVIVREREWLWLSS